MTVTKFPTRHPGAAFIEHGQEMLDRAKGMPHDPMTHADFASYDAAYIKRCTPRSIVDAAVMLQAMKEFRDRRLSIWTSHNGRKTPEAVRAKLDYLRASRVFNRMLGLQTDGWNLEISQLEVMLDEMEGGEEEMTPTP